MKKQSEILTNSGQLRLRMRRGEGRGDSGWWRVAIASLAFLLSSIKETLSIFLCRILSLSWYK